MVSTVTEYQMETNAPTQYSSSESAKPYPTESASGSKSIPSKSATDVAVTISATIHIHAVAANDECEDESSAEPTSKAAPSSAYMPPSAPTPTSPPACTSSPPSKPTGYYAMNYYFVGKATGTVSAEENNEGDSDDEHTILITVGHTA
ncbi:hypothetical protein GGH91_002980 [Coemansia sp. RSA 2671]|nr:hypothetical protein GGH91_002980 [Coemansia sp. RSA 2671]